MVVSGWISLAFSWFNSSTALRKFCMVDLTTWHVPDIDVNQLVSLREAQHAYRLSDEVVPEKNHSSTLYPCKIYFSPQRKKNSETTSLPARGSGNVCVHSTLSEPHLWDYSRYVIFRCFDWVPYIVQCFVLIWNLLLQKGLGRGRYFPITAIQRFDAAVSFTYLFIRLLTLIKEITLNLDDKS